MRVKQPIFIRRTERKLRTDRQFLCDGAALDQKLDEVIQGLEQQWGIREQGVRELLDDEKKKGSSIAGGAAEIEEFWLNVKRAFGELNDLRARRTGRAEWPFIGVGEMSRWEFRHPSFRML